MMVENKSKKSIKWWVKTMSLVVLFLAIGVFSYIKMDYVIKGVKIKAEIDKTGNSSLVYIKGSAKNAVYVSLNGREIFIEKDGTFREPVALQEGLVVVTIDALDKFGRSKEKKFEVIYEKEKGVVALGDIIINTN